MENMNILIVGVGGQGTLLASRVLGAYASAKGLDCKVSEVHGMSQRGGSVVTYVKMGEKIFSPTIAAGEADVILSFELLEAERWAHCLRAGGSMVVNTQKILPMPVISGSRKYPEDIEARLASRTDSVTYVDAYALACKAGSQKTLNIVMIGKFARIAGLDYAEIESAVASCVPEKLRDMNITALKLGYGE